MCAFITLPYTSSRVMTQQRSVVNGKQAKATLPTTIIKITVIVGVAVHADHIE